MKDFKPKSFWEKPEGTTGMFFLSLLLIGGGYLLFSNIIWIIGALQSTIALVIAVLVLAAVVFMALDPKARALFGYMYKSFMRWITGLFVEIDPIGILKSYVADLKDNLKKMTRQIGKLRGQMHKLQELIHNNKKEIKSNLSQASRAKEEDRRNVMILKSRKAGRLKESNYKYEDLYTKMEVLYRVLAKMHENSAILTEDIEDQVEVKEQERKAIQASHSAMKSAMTIISGDKDKRAIFDEALEAIADDVSQKVGEMERFMEVSSNFMDSVDLQNGVFEAEGLAMLEKWEKEGESLLLGDEKDMLLLASEDRGDVLDLNRPIRQKEKLENRTNQYDKFFE